MLTDENAGGEPEEQPEESEVPPSPDELLYVRLRDMLLDFSVRQSEILRLVDFMGERAAEIDNAARRARQLISTQLDSVDPIDEDVVDVLMTLFTELESDDLGDATLSQEERQDAMLTALRDASENLPPGHTQTYVDSVLRALHAPPGADVLRSSLLVTLVGELEVLVGNLARAGFERQPTALDTGGRSFTWADIVRYESIDDIRDEVVDRAIEDILRGSLKDWIEYFVKRFGVGDISVAKQWSAQETIQRRHCIVHNGGSVSSQYLEKLRSFKPTVQVGDDLDVDSAYLRRAADTLYLVGFSLVWAVAVKLARQDDVLEGFGELFANRTYFLLQERRLELVKSIGANVPIDRLDEDVALVIQVNYWLAHKLNGEFDEVRQDVADMKVASRSRQFNLAKHALLDEHEDAYRVAQSMIRDEELSPAHLFTWPLLSGVRGWLRNKSEPSAVAETDASR